MGKKPNRSDQNPLEVEGLISLKAGAAYCGLSQVHLRYLANHGELRAVKVGRNWVTTKAAVDEYLRRNRRPGPTKLNK